MHIRFGLMRRRGGRERRLEGAETSPGDRLVRKEA